MKTILLEVDEEEFDQLFDTNVKGIYYVLQESLPYLVKQKREML